ncbi:MAG: YggT family protein [Pyrinomonadaceae bacterium]
MLLSTVYPKVWLALWVVFLVFVTLMLTRMLVSYLDPNPFGAVGRAGFKLRKLTERFVYPAARFLATFRVNTRYAPLVSIFIALVFTYFLSSIIENTFRVIDGLTDAIWTSNPSKFIGWTLYGLLSVFVLLIFIRFLSSWFVFTKNTFLGFVKRVTEPMMLPVQRIIPTIGMFDISTMIVLLLISFLQVIVLNVFVIR